MEDIKKEFYKKFLKRIKDYNKKEGLNGTMSLELYNELLDQQWDWVATKLKEERIKGKAEMGDMVLENSDLSEKDDRNLRKYLVELKQGLEGKVEVKQPIKETKELSEFEKEYLRPFQKG